jgi:hypothetical protein
MHALSRTWLGALGALLCGVAVYAVDAGRGAQAWFVPALDFPAWTFPAGAGGFLPSFAHTYAFATMCALVRAASARQAYVWCAVWCAIDLLFEFAQLPVVTRAVAALPLDDRAVELVTRSIYGTYDGADVAAIVIGGLAACWTAHTLQRGERP